MQVGFYFLNLVCSFIFFSRQKTKMALEINTIVDMSFVFDRLHGLCCQNGAPMLFPALWRWHLKIYSKMSSKQWCWMRDIMTGWRGNFPRRNVKTRHLMAFHPQSPVICSTSAFPIFVLSACYYYPSFAATGGLKGRAAAERRHRAAAGGDRCWCDTVEVSVTQQSFDFADMKGATMTGTKTLLFHLLIWPHGCKRL